jgi:hypothetical protein
MAGGMGMNPAMGAYGGAYGGQLPTHTIKKLLTLWFPSVLSKWPALADVSLP